MIARLLTWLWRQTVGGFVTAAYKGYRAEREHALSPEDSDVIRREIRDGTPNTPQRVAFIREADEVYARLRPSAVSRPI